MDLERVAVALRPRTEWEAVDLGFRMARQWWRPIWGVWLALYLPVAGILLAAIPNTAIAVLVIWWLKPVFDRAVLHAVSRAVFGEACGVRATLRSAAEWLRPGLIGALTFYRLDLARSFTLPVSSLEKQTGKAARKRRSVLGARGRGQAVWLFVTCLHIEWLVVMPATFLVVSMLEPSAAEFLPDREEAEGMLGIFQGLADWTVRDAIHYVVAVCLVEPFYVTAGFALYLNRRTILEGWDIEVQLRRLEQRLRSTGAVAAVVLAATLAFAALGSPNPAWAQNAKSPSQEIREVLAGPDFGAEREVTRLRYLGESKQREQAESKPFRLSEAWSNLILLLADISQALIWIGAGVIVAILLYALWRYIPEPRLRPRGYRPPETLFGLELAPESLPDDVAAAAAAAAEAGRYREALSLLYRGSLSALVHRFEVALQAGDTEGDCVRAAGRALPESAGQYFAELVNAWRTAAYAGLPPGAGTVPELCRGWNQHFRLESRP